MKSFRVTKDGREICFHRTTSGRQDYKARTLAMAERQGWLCGLCGLAMTRETVTFDHEFGRGMGGARRDDRIEVNGWWFNAAVHYVCNSLKASRAVPYVVTQESVCLTHTE